MNLAQELKSRAALLDELGWQEATRRVLGLLNWMNEQSEIKRILDELKAKGRMYEQLKIGTDRRRVAEVATEPEDVAAIGLAMAEACSARNGIDQFHQIAHSFGVQPPPGMIHPADFLANQAIKLYIKPLLSYVAEHLPEKQPAATTAEPSREQLTLEFLEALCQEYERDPLPTHWIILDEIWKRVTEKYGDGLSSDRANTAFRHLYAGRFINQVTGAGGVRIQINERGLAAYHQMKASYAPSASSQSSDPRTVFVVHGRNEPLRKSMFDFLRAIGLKPLEWSQAIIATGEASPYIGQVLDTAFSIAQAVVVLMTPDDEAYLKKEHQTEHDADYERKPTGQARPNVLFEAGMAFGRHPKRTLLVEIGTLRPFSDVGGRHVLRLNNSTERRQDLAERLLTAGCAVDLSGRDWHSAGSFDLGQSAPQQSASSSGVSWGSQPHIKGRMEK